jgi:glutaryl-CoA dehydrogenase (non-decarboxylating)
MQVETELNCDQLENWERFTAFVKEYVAPDASRYDRDERIPRSLISELASRGHLGMTLPKGFGGREVDSVSYGLFHHEVGRCLSSLGAIVTVHDMTSHTIARWGNTAQKNDWLPRLARGESLAAFAITEANAGSDVRAVEATAERRGQVFLLSGKKKWLTAGQIADLFLVLAKLDEKPAAFLVERNRPGLCVTPVYGMLGLRAGMLAELDLCQCEVPQENLIGRPGFAIESVIETALDLGRYAVGWECVGLAQACLDLSISYADERRQFGVPLREHQLIAQMITDMICHVAAARQLCWVAGRLRDLNDSRALASTLVSKYFASRAAMKVAVDAVQIHGANGCSDQMPLQQFMRDAKVMEIIEGSNQVQQILIAKLVRPQRHARAELAGTPCHRDAFEKVEKEERL